MLLNEKTKQHLKAMRFSGGNVYLLTGGKGSGRMTYVRKTAASFLKTQEKYLLDQPDYYELCSEKSVGINDLLELRDYAEYQPACASCKIAVIDAPTLTDEAQASLLKLLEDGATHVMFILIVNSILLDTIRSRGREICFLPVEAEKMNELGGELVARAMAFGKPGVFYQFSQPEWKAYVQTCECTAAALVALDRVRLLQCLHLVKEKDKESFFERYGRSYAALWLRYLSEQVASAIAACTTRTEREKLLNIETQVCSERFRMENAKVSYSKNDFFDLICRLCECC